jgi:hypothetical protein
MIMIYTIDIDESLFIIYDVGDKDFIIIKIVYNI